MRKNKAVGVDGIQTEHLLFAHPLVTVQLCCLFNVMLNMVSFQACLPQVSLFQFSRIRMVTLLI